MGIPLYIFYHLTYPAIWILNSCSNVLLKLVLRNQIHREHEDYSTQEIKLILNSSRVSGEITAEEAEIMEHTLDFADLRITEVMRPKDELICLDENSKFEDILPIVLQTKFTRYPLFKGDPSNITGMVHVKDIFINNSDDNSRPLKSLLRPILKISARSTALDVLMKFKNGSSHLALIYKGQKLIGFVTLDNLLHVIIGKIKDEFHHTKDDWIKNSDNSITIDGDCTIYSLEQAFDVDIPENEEGRADNVTQLIINYLGKMPVNDQIIKTGEVILHVINVENDVITKIIAKKQNVNT